MTTATDQAWLRLHAASTTTRLDDDSGARDTDVSSERTFASRNVDCGSTADPATEDPSFILRFAEPLDYDHAVTSASDIGQTETFGKGDGGYRDTDVTAATQTTTKLADPVSRDTDATMGSLSPIGDRAPGPSQNPSWTLGQTNTFNEDSGGARDTDVHSADPLPIGARPLEQS